MESSEDVARLRAATDDSEFVEQLQNVTINTTNNTTTNASTNSGIGKDKLDGVIMGIREISTQLELTSQYELSAHLLHKSSSISSLRLNQFDPLKSPLERSIYLNNRKRFFRCSSCNLESTIQNPWFPLVYRHLDSEGSCSKDIQYALFRPLTSNFTTDDLDLLTLPISSKCDCQDLSSTCFDQADLSPISEPLASTYNRKNSISQPLTVVNCRKSSKSGKKVVCYSITRLLNFDTEYQVYQCIDRDNMDSFALKLIAKDDRLVSNYIYGFNLLNSVACTIIHLYIFISCNNYYYICVKIFVLVYFLLQTVCVHQYTSTYLINRLLLPLLYHIYLYRFIIILIVLSTYLHQLRITPIKYLIYMYKYIFDG